MLKLRCKLSILGVYLAYLVTIVYAVRANGTDLQTGNEKALNLLVTVPYPPGDGGWDGGIPLVAATRLAFKQINEKTDFLPGYRLEAIVVESGCRVETTAVQSMIENVFYSDKNIVGIIGPGCSDPALLLAPVLSSPDLSLIQIAPSAASPKFLSLNVSTTFILTSPDEIINNTFDFMKAMDWKQCVTMFDQNRDAFTTQHNTFRNESKSHNISIKLAVAVSGDELSMGEADTVNKHLETLKQKLVRIIILFAAPPVVRSVMCLAYHKSMYYPTFQWIIKLKSLNELNPNMSDPDSDPLEVQLKGFNCTEEQMKQVFNGSIITEYALNRPNDTHITPMNITYQQYREAYLPEFESHLKEVQHIVNASGNNTKNYNKMDYWENTYYDAAWIWGKALDQVVSRRGINLSTYRYGQQNITDVILEEFYNVKFEGATGPIEFTPSRNVHSPIWTSHLIGITATELLCTRVNITFNCSKSVMFKRINDEFQKIPERVHEAVAVIVIITTVVVALFSAVLHIAFVIFSDTKSVKATSPTLSHLIFSGCYLFCIASLLSILQQTLEFGYTQEDRISYSIFCNAIVWCVIVGASLIFGTMFVKVFRIFKLFRHFRNKRPGMFLSDRSLTFVVLILVAVDCVFCVCWNWIDPYVMGRATVDNIDFNIEQGDTDIKVILQCECENEEVWVGIVIGFKGLILVLLVVFATLNRKIQRKHFAHTKKVNILVYCLTGICVAGFSLLFILDNISVYVLLIFCAILLATVILCCALLFVPPLFHLKEAPKTPSRADSRNRSIRTGSSQRTPVSTRYSQFRFVFP